MHDPNSLSADECTVMQFCLRRMAVGAFGSLATIPLFCLGELGGGDAGPIISDHYDIWRSCLTVARVLLQTKPFSMDAARGQLDGLFEIAADLRNAYVELSEYEKSPADQTLAAYAKLVSSFDRIATCVGDLGKAANLDVSPILSLLSMRRKYYGNSLQWFGDEIRGKVATADSRQELAPAIAQ